MAFLLSFLGCLFAFVLIAAGVYTYVTLILIPKFGKAMKEKFMEGVKIGAPLGAALAKVNDADVQAVGAGAVVGATLAQTEGVSYTDGQRVMIFTCEDHGRCPGCPRVLKQFEAIAREQGEDSMDDLERTIYAELRAQFPAEVKVA